MSSAITEPPQLASLKSELAKLFSRIGRGLRYRTRAACETLDITRPAGPKLTAPV